MTFFDQTITPGDGKGVPPHPHDASEISGNGAFITLRVNKLLAGTITGKEIIIAGGADGILRSDNFVAGSDGWQILGDGTAELNDVTVRGSLDAGTIVGNLTMDGGHIQTGTSAPYIIFGELANADRFRWEGLSSGTEPFMKARTISGAPSIEVNSGANSGGVSADIVLTAGASTSQATIDATYLRPTGLLQGPDGSSSAPAYSFLGDPDTGIYRYGTNIIGFATAGVHRWMINASGTLQGNTMAITGTSLVRTAVGSVGAPSFTFDTDTDTGMYLASDGVLAFATGGVLRGSFQADGIYATTPNTSGSAANLVTAGSAHNNFQRSTSALKYKSRVTTKVDYLADIDLIPTKHWRKDDKRWRYGLIADWLGAQDRLLGVYEDGEIDNYDDRAVMAVMAAKIARLEKTAALERQQHDRNRPNPR